MRADMDLERRARQRDKTDVFADESEALDQIAKQVRMCPSLVDFTLWES